MMKVKLVLLIILLGFFTSIHASDNQRLFEDSTQRGVVYLPQNDISGNSYNKHVKRLRTIKANTSALINKKRLIINLFEDEVFLVEKVKEKFNKRGALVWTGNVSQRINGAKNKAIKGSIVLIMKNDKINGTVRVDSRLFSIRPTSDGYHRVEEIDERKLPPDHPDNYDSITKPPSNSGSQALPLEVTVAGLNTSRTLVVYTPAVAAAVADIPGLIDLAIAETNISFSNSAVSDDLSIELSGSAQIDYVEEADFTSALIKLATPNDSVMDSVHQLRLDDQADIVVLLVDNPAYCGVAYINASYEEAFAVVHYTCATGYYSFAHEIGHLHAARHDVANDPSTTPFAYGHGYQSPTDLFRTIMAYDCTTGCPRISNWSNPDLLYSGEVTGVVGESNNARLMRETANRIANLHENYTPPPPGIERWFYNVSATVYATPAIANDGSIYFGSRNNTFYALNPDGTLRWSYATPLGITGSASLDDDTVYFKTYTGAEARLYALYQSDGSLKWSKLIPGSITAPSIGDDGTLYVRTNKLVALNPDGVEQWSSTLIDSYASASIGSDGTIYVDGGFTKTLHAFDSNGQALWSFVADSGIRQSASIDDNGNIYFSSQNGTLYAFNSSGAQQWSYALSGSNFNSSPVIDAANNILIGDGAGRLYSISNNGQLNWTQLLSSNAVSTPAIADDGSIYLTTGNKMFALDASGNTLWTSPIIQSGQSSVAMGLDGLLYVGSDSSANGGVYAFDGGNIKPGNTPWPMKHHDAAHTGRYRLPNQAPVIAISSPGAGAFIEQGSAITLAATASDVEDGNLSTQIQWDSDIDGFITSPVTLSLALHVLTATVTDSDGASTSAFVTVEVLSSSADKDVDGMPNGWEIQNNLNPDDASDATDNPDGDALNNLQEYLNGSDPNVSDNIMGDINNDGQINAADLLLMQRYLFNLNTLDIPEIARGDLYPAGVGDGVLTTSDLLLLTTLVLAN